MRNATPPRETSSLNPSSIQSIWLRPVEKYRPVGSPISDPISRQQREVTWRESLAWFSAVKEAQSQRSKQRAASAFRCERSLSGKSRPVLAAHETMSENNRRVYEALEVWGWPTWLRKTPSDV